MPFRFLLAFKTSTAFNTIIVSFGGRGIIVRPEIKLAMGKAVIAKTGISFKWKDFRATGGQLAIDSGVSIEQVSRSMRHASVVTTERYYCRARADLAYARVNDAYNGVFVHEPAITGKSV
jgi:integrase